MTEKFGSAIYLVLALHAFMLAMAAFCAWLGWRIRVLRDLKLVRDAKHVPLPNRAVIADRYGNSYIVSAIALVLLAMGSLLGLPFDLWLFLSVGVAMAQRLYRIWLGRQAE